MAVLDWEPVLSALGTIDAELEDVEYANLGSTEYLQQQIDTVLQQQSGGILDALIGAVEAAGRLASGLLESLADTRDYWAPFFEGAHHVFLTRKEAIEQWVTEFVNGIIEHINGEWQSEEAIDSMLVRSTPNPSITTGSTVEDYHQAVQNQPRIIGSVANVASLVAGIIAILNARIKGYVSGVEQTSLMDSQTTPLGLGQLTELLKRKDVGETWAKQQATRLGISGNLFDLAMKIEQQRLTPDHYITAWLRTKHEAHIDEIRKQGVAEDDIERLLYLAFAEPTPSDIVRFLVRDAYDEGAVSRNQYDADFDVKYNQDAFDRVGVSEQLAKLYWRAHWQLPSPTQGYEMLHRGLITMDQLRDLLKLADYAPGWVDHLIGSAYLQPGRIDLRRMWEVGIITDRAELVNRYEKIGYQHDDAETLANFSITLADRTKANEAERKRRPLATQIARSYSQGLLDRETAKATLVSIGFLDEDAEAFLKEADYNRERDRSDRIRDAIGRQFTRGSITSDEARDKLASYGFLDGEITLNLDSWTLDRELRDWTEAEQHERDLSRADIVTAFENAILPPADAFASLMALGYDSGEADTILELSAAKVARADAKAEQDAIRVQYLNRRIDEGEASNRLDAIGTPAQRRDAMLARWTVEREERAPDLPVSWLERLIFNALIDQDEARAEMERRGYTEQEIDWALRLWGEDVSVARERLAQQQAQFSRRLEQQAQQAAARLSVQERALELRERTATTAQLLQQDRFERTLEQRQALADQRIDAAARSRVEAASLQADRDARQFARQKEIQSTALQAQVDRLQRQLDAATARQEDAQRQQNELQQRREELSLRLASIQDARQQRTIEAQDARLTRQLEAAATRAQQANDLRLTLQANQQAFQDQQRQAREAASEAVRIAQEAARIRQESRAEATRIRQETRAGARRTIERAETAIQTESLRSLQLQRDSAIAELNARIAALEAESAEARISLAEERQRVAQDELTRLMGPALVFEPML